MSIRVMTFVWDHAPVKGSKLIVLLALADHANDHGHCWPSMERIAHRARMSERQAQRVIVGLVDEGLLRVEKRNGQSSLYTVLLGGRTSTSGVTSSVDTPDIAMSPEPSIEPSKEVVDEKESKKENRATATQLENEAIDRVWSYWLNVSGKNQQLDEKRKRIIRSALGTMRRTHRCELPEAEQLVSRAVLGLSRSPHHNGVNEQHKTYLEIRYALKGIGDESDDERIEKAIAWATIYQPGVNGVDGAKVERWLDQVRYHLGKRAIDPNSMAGRERAEDAYRKLKAAGFTLTRFNRPPYAEVSR